MEVSPALVIKKVSPALPKASRRERIGWVLKAMVSTVVKRRAKLVGSRNNLVQVAIEYLP